MSGDNTNMLVAVSAIGLIGAALLLVGKKPTDKPGVKNLSVLARVKA